MNDKHFLNKSYSAWLSCREEKFVNKIQRTVAERIKEHLADVRYGQEKAVSFHFNSADHEIDDMNYL